MEAVEDSIDESPASPMNEKVGDSEYTPAIPVYSISDSDTERATSFMQNMSHSLMQTGSEQSPADEYNPEEPDIIAPLDPDPSNSPEQEKGPSIQVLFMNTDIGRKYRHDIEEFFHTLMTAENLIKNPEPLPRIQRRPNLNLTDEELKNDVVHETTVVGAISVSFSIFRNFLVIGALYTEVEIIFYKSTYWYYLPTNGDFNISYTFQNSLNGEPAL